MHISIFKYTTLLCCLPLLSGCFEDRRSTDQICQKRPDLKCSELNVDDGQCRIPRTNLIWHRLDVLRHPSDLNKIKEYQLTQEYKQCMEVAGQIQPIHQEDLKLKRYESLVNANKSLKRIAAELEEYKTPHALYFLASQLGNKQAQRQFLQLEGSPELESADLQYALATFYISRDREKTIQLLYRALELTDPKNINISIIESLASLYQLRQQNETAYIWALVSKHYGAPVSSMKKIQQRYHFSDQEIDKLSDIADKVISAIDDRQFTPTLIPTTF